MQDKHIVFFVLLFYTFFLEPVGKYFGGLRKSIDRIKLFYLRQWQRDIYCTKKHVKLNILFQVIFHAVLRFFWLSPLFCFP